MRAGRQSRASGQSSTAPPAGYIRPAVWLTASRLAWTGPASRSTACSRSWPRPRAPGGLQRASWASYGPRCAETWASGGGAPQPPLRGPVSPPKVSGFRWAPVPALPPTWDTPLPGPRSCTPQAPCGWAQQREGVRVPACLSPPRALSHHCPAALDGVQGHSGWQSDSPATRPIPMALTSSLLQRPSPAPADHSPDVDVAAVREALRDFMQKLRDAQRERVRGADMPWGPRR